MQDLLENRSDGPKSIKNDTQNDAEMTPKWSQNCLEICPGRAKAALWGPGRASSLFLIFFDAILGFILGPSGCQNASKNQSKIDAINYVGKVRNLC